MKYSTLLVVAAVPYLIATNAAIVFGQYGPGALGIPAELTYQRRVAVGSLTQGLRDPSPAVRQAAAVALGQIGPEAKDAIPALASLLRDQDGYVRIDAAHTLEKFRGNSVPYLVRLLHDWDEKTRLLAVHTLEVIGQDAKPAVPTLIGQLSDPSPAVRDATTYALRAIGTDAKSAGPALAAMLRDPDRIVRLGAAKTLRHLGPDVIPYIAPLTADREPRVRELAITTMREIAEQYWASPPSSTP
jgi:HEAT repeat protein